MQFHPESILTEHGHDLLRNFLERPPPTHSDSGEIMDIKIALAKVVDGHSLGMDEMKEVMTQIMTGRPPMPRSVVSWSPCAPRAGESIEEITGAAEVMRSLATKVQVAHEHLVDTCGTGGDGANLFNVSTASAFVVAAAGGRVAKHGNRSVSSSTGSGICWKRPVSISASLRPGSLMHQ